MRNTIIATGALILAGLLVAYISAGSQRLSNLEVKSGGIIGTNGVLIRNVGQTTIKLLNVILNDRDECSIEHFPGFNFSKEQLHQAFVFGFEVPRPGSIKIREERILQIGESALFILSCSGTIVRVSIWTDQGAGTYTFNR